MAATVEIKGNFDRQDGGDPVLGTLYFTLSKRDIDAGTIIEPYQQTVELDNAGGFRGLRLWPNDRGQNNSSYRLEYMPAGSRKREVLSEALFVPETGAPHELSDLITASQIARASKLDRIIPISAEQFAAKQSAGTLVDGLYLVEGAQE